MIFIRDGKIYYRNYSVIEKTDVPWFNETYEEALEKITNKKNDEET